ncbi:DinB family protein [Micromonospora sp. GCM10011542]|uniref:DinB family protein n=1 Tax=Micromonospora sp. GCM10011542 TaxID=3317337 RepID=UPI003617DF7B
MADFLAESDAQTPQPDGQPIRTFGWLDRFVHPDEDPRSGGGFSDERTILVHYLRDQRLTFQLKCDGLDADQLARRAIPPSTMSLLGLIRHLAEVERGWFRRTMAGQDALKIYASEADPDGDFDGAVADPEVVAEAWRTWQAEVEFAERFVAEAPDLGVQGRQRLGNTVVLRELLVHMIEEYARHNGHADLLRERIDGRVGE